MLTVGNKFPEFNLTAVVSNNLKNAFMDVNDTTYADKWKIVFFWPKDFTFICPTELAEFGKMTSEFESRNAQILGVSVDSEFVHHAWRNQNDALNDLPYPMLSDIKRELSEACGILDQKEGVALRATFIVDPENVIRHVAVNDLSVGRSPKETLRILDGLQEGGLCPCNWQKGDDTIQVAA